METYRINTAAAVPAILDAAPESIIVLRAGDLKEAVIGLHNRIYEFAREEARAALEEVTLTTDELCKRFGVDKTTVWRWKKQGLITPVNKAGRKNQYRVSDVIRITGAQGGANNDG